MEKEYHENSSEVPPPLRQDCKKLHLDYPSSAEFTGPWEWAHRHNILGAGTHILIIVHEVDGFYSHSHIEEKIEDIMIML